MLRSVYGQVPEKEHPVHGERRKLMGLKPGDYFGQYALLGDKLWGSENGCACDYEADDLCELRSISYATLQRVLTQVVRTCCVFLPHRPPCP